MDSQVQEIRREKGKEGNGYRTEAGPSSFEHSPRKRIWPTRTCGTGRWLHWGSEGPMSRVSEVVQGRETGRETGKKTDTITGKRDRWQWYG